MRLVRHGQTDGFTLVELSIALVVIGLVTAVGLAIYRPTAETKRGMVAVIFQKQVEQALFNFALTHHRLPCADTTGDGYEATNCQDDNTARTGAVPYATLGIISNGLSTGNINTSQNIIYGVYRKSNSNPVYDADLAVIKERTGNAIDSTSYQDINDFRQALINAESATVEKTQVYVTGDGYTTSDENCLNNVVANAAFYLASTGAEDMDGDGNPFDGVNVNLKKDGSGSQCFASPTRLHDAGYDDFVQGVSFNGLLGFLNQNHK